MEKILIYGDSNLWGYNFIENKRLDDKHISLELTDKAKEYLIDNGYSQIYGATFCQAWYYRMGSGYGIPW